MYGNRGLGIEIKGEPDQVVAHPVDRAKRLQGKTMNKVLYGLIQTEKFLQVATLAAVILYVGYLGCAQARSDRAPSVVSPGSTLQK
jgi:hypothetical protein